MSSKIRNIYVYYLLLTPEVQAPDTSKNYSITNLFEKYGKYREPWVIVLPQTWIDTSCGLTLEFGGIRLYVK